MPTLATPTQLIEFERGRTVVSCELNDRYIEMIDWVDQNSTGDVSVKLCSSTQKDDKWYADSQGFDRVFFAFENADDALLFRIKYVNR